MECANPECDSEVIYIKGLCQPCYHRQWRNGSVTRHRARYKPGTICSIEGCELVVHANGHCAKHYQHGRHPLEVIWRNLRSRYPGEYPDHWNKGVKAFVADVGERPADGWQLRRNDGDLPWAKGNCEWREPIKSSTVSGATVDMAAYQRAWSLFRKFKLRESDVLRMRADQHEKCPICDTALAAIHPDTGKVIKICVDHSHVTGAVRALLHDHCNKGLGHLNDSASNCIRAAAYLTHHAGLDAPAIDSHPATL